MRDHDAATRDLTGYGGRYPEFSWPGGARVAVNIVLNYEEGAERTIATDDTPREGFGEVVSSVPRNERDLGNESVYEYGSRAGVWRLLGILSEHEVPFTVFAAAAALEKNAAVAEALTGYGCDFTAHGYLWESHAGKTNDEVQRDITRATEAIETITGIRPAGWFTRYATSVHTRSCLSDAGYQFDSSAFNDDLPYWDNQTPKPLLIMPYGLDTNDVRFWRGTSLTSRDFSEYLIDTFDTLYAEGATAPKMMSVGLHARIAGRPGRASALIRFLDHVQAHSDVWLARRSDIADWWISQRL